jgi:hypothetical protein
MMLLWLIIDGWRDVAHQLMPVKAGNKENMKYSRGCCLFWSLSLSTLTREPVQVNSHGRRAHRHRKPHASGFKGGEGGQVIRSLAISASTQTSS